MHDTQELELPPPPAAMRGPACESCGGSMMAGQRYCLHCGARRGEPRLPLDEALATRAEPAAPPPPPGVASRDWTPLAALGGLALLAIMLVVGILIGKTGSSESAGAPQVIKVAGGGGPGTDQTSAVSAETFKSDWPAGKKGFTVELGELPKTTAPSAVAGAKSDAAGKGAPKVGVLASDDFASLPPGKYVVYSGVYSTRKEAAAALKPLKAKFPQAKVVEVSDSGATASSGGDFAGKKKATLNQKDLENLNNLSGNDYEKQSRKLPTTTVLPGKPPPADGKAPGGGGGGTVIK